MAILSNTVWRAHPGQTARLLELASEGKKIHERLGANGSVVQWSSAGALTGTLTYGLIFPDMPAWGQFSDTLAEDKEWQDFTRRALGADAPGTVISQTLAVDQPGFDAPDPASPGTFIAAIVSNVAPDHSAAEVLQVATEIKTVAIDLGAKWMRFRRTIAGGESSLSFAATLGFDSAAAFGEWQAKVWSDTRGIALNQRWFGPASPVTGHMLAYGRVLSI